jgi:signal transduction histidine kinase
MATEPSAPTASPRHALLPAVNPGSWALYSVATPFEAGTDPADILQTLLRRAAAAVAARAGWLLGPEPDLPARIIAAWPDAGAAPPDEDTASVLSQPLLHGGKPVATLVLASPAAGSFGGPERRLAAALAHPAGAVTAVALRLAAAEDRACRAEGQSALRAEVAAAVDHDLRTPLTTVLGSLQTLARPEFAPADPDLAALLSSALGQAKRLRFLLGDLLLASSTEPAHETLAPEGLQALIADAARSGMGEGAQVPIDIPRGFAPVAVDPPALRRTLDGILRRACRRGLTAGVEVAAWGEDAVIAVAADGEGPLVPELSARLAAAMGATIDEARGAQGGTVVQVVLPGALRPA